jgi:hypothetical protein
VAFSLGALLGGRLLRGPQKLQERRIGFAIEWVLIVAATALTWVSEPNAHNLAGNLVVAMLALAMVIQNAMVRVHGVPDLATNSVAAGADKHRLQPGHDPADVRQEAAVSPLRLLIGFLTR